GPDDDRLCVDTLTRELREHELAGRIGADNSCQGHPEPEPRGSHRRDRGRSAHHQRDAANQLLLLAEFRHHVVTEHEHVRIAVAAHQQVRFGMVLGVLRGTAHASITRTPASANLAAASSARPASVTSTSMSLTAQIRAKALRPTFELSATTAT